MEQRNIDRVLSLIGRIEGEQKEYLEQYITNAPIWILESFHIVEFDANTIFIRENEEVEQVYILIKGIIKACDYRVFGITYDYMRLRAVKSFGTMELLLNLDRYMTTLETVTPCTMLVIARKKYERWMKSDMNALLAESKMMVNYLLEQARHGRLFLFMQGTDRLAYIFTQIYEEEEKDGVCIVRATRQELSDCSGLSVKTMNRSIAQLLEQGYIRKEGNKIKITEEQYLKMQALIAQKIEQ